MHMHELAPNFAIQPHFALCIGNTILPASDLHLVGRVQAEDVKYNSFAHWVWLVAFLQRSWSSALDCDISYCAFVHSN